MNKNTKISDFLTNLKKETNVFKKFEKILKKSESDGHLSKIHLILNEIFDKELNYLISGWIIRHARKTGNQEPNDIQNGTQIQSSRIQGELQADPFFIWFIH